MKKLLDDTEAAIKLGITKELLYAYIRNAPKKHLGHDKKLLTILKDGKNYFKEADLEEFDKYLKEPWSKPGEPRPDIPKYIQEYLKIEIEGRCPISSKGYPLDNAHIIPYSESLNHHHHNLIRIAKDEHTKADNGVLPRNLLSEIKKKLVDNLRNRLNVENNRYHSSFYPPNPHPIFIGRMDKLHELTESMEFERLIVVEGIGGMGKTQLVLNALSNVVYHNPVLWIDIENIQKVNDLLLILNNAISNYIGNSQSGSLFDTLRHTQITLVFDSLENLLISDKDNTEDFINALMTNTHHVQIIITSQIDLSLLDHPKNIIRLEPISHDDSLLLMKILLEEKKKVNQDHLNQIIEFCNGHPLSIKLIVSLIKFYNSSKIVIEILNKGKSLKHPTRTKLDKYTAVYVCLSTIYDILTENQERILQFVKFFPAGLKLIHAKNLINTSTFAEDIPILQMFFFIEIRKDRLELERLYVSNPIRSFLKEKSIRKSKVENDTQKSALNHLLIEVVIIDHYIQTGQYNSSSFGLNRIEDELPNLLEALRIAQSKAENYKKLSDIKLKNEYLNIVAGITSSLGKFCFARGLFEYGIFFSKAGINANIEIGQFENASMEYMYLGQIQARQFDFDGLSITVKELENLVKKTKIIEIQANAVWLKGLLNFEKENYDQALICYEETICLLQKIKQNRAASKNLNELIKFEEDSSFIEGNIAVIMFEIAKVYEFTGRYHNAIEKYKLAQKKLVPLKDQINLPSCFHHLAHCYCEIGKFKEGISFYLKAVRGFNDIGQFEFIVNSISDLGRYVTEQPEIAKLDLIDEQLLTNALERIGYQINDFIQREMQKCEDISLIIGNIPYPLISNLVLMIKFISFSPYRLVLSNFFAELTEKIGIQNISIGYLSAIINVGHAVGGIDQWRDLSINRSLMVKTILQGCLILNGGPDLKGKTKIFDWLAKWMQFTELDAKATVESLWNEAWESFEQ